MSPAPRACTPLAALIVTALATVGQPQPPAVQIVTHRLGAPPATPMQHPVGDEAGAFTPILDPNDVDPNDVDPDDAGEDPDESEDRDGSENEEVGSSGRDGSNGQRERSEPSERDGRGWGTAQSRLPTPGRQPEPELGETSLARLIEDVTAADGYRYNARDSAGSTMDTAKVIDNPGGGYLAVYHTGNVIKLATSTDLKIWRFRANLDPRASQPTIVATSDGGYLVAVETETSNNGQIKLLHYRDLAALQAGRTNRTFTAPRTLSSCNEGTPSITSVRLAPDIDHSVIELGMHYHRNCDTDREATARLTNFRQWKATASPGTDSALARAAATLGKKISGNIGDRDTLAVGRRRFSLNEVQYVKGQFGSWRTYLYDAAAGRARPLNIRTHRGSRAFANPTFSRITAPNGRPAIVIGLYLPAQGSALLEAGELIYFRTLPGSSGELQAEPTSRTRTGPATDARAGGTP